MKLPIQSTPVNRDIFRAISKCQTSLGINPLGTCFAARNCYPHPKLPMRHAQTQAECCEHIYPNGSFSYGSGCSNCPPMNDSSIASQRSISFLTTPSLSYSNSSE